MAVVGEPEVGTRGPGGAGATRPEGVPRPLGRGGGRANVDVPGLTVASDL